MQELYAGLMKLDEWPGIVGQSVPIAPVADRPDLAGFEGHIVTLISFDLRAQGRIEQYNGWWFGILTSPVEDNPVTV